MPKELDGYRLQLENIIARFGDKQLLTITDVGVYLGGKESPLDARTVKNRISITNKGITQIELARQLSLLCANI